MSILINWLESLHEEVKVSSKCVRERNRKSECCYCKEKCEHEAIIVKENQLIIDADKCTMCGECMIACPLSAIEGIVSNRVFDGASLVFDLNYVPSIKELLIYKKRGMASIQVSHQPLNEKWKTVISHANNHLILLEESPIEVVQKNSDEVLSRRAFFGSFHKEGKQLAKSMAPAAWKKESDDWKLTKYYPDFQFYSVDLKKEQCTFCQTCFTLCPENVFKIQDGTLRMQTENCVNCTSCIDVCQEHAIVILPDIQKRREHQEQVHSRTCINCGHNFYSFHSETEKCHVCINRDPEWLNPY
jgi:Fe-S-cluster-containing hydrogenase component 2